MSFNVETSDAQTKYCETVLSCKYTFCLYAGSIRSGKTWMCIILFIILCRVYPGSRWLVVRSDLPTLKRNTIPTFNKLAPRKLFPVPPKFTGDYVAKAVNGSEIIFMAEQNDRDPDKDRFKGLEVNGALLEQLEELQKDTFDIVLQRIGQWKLDKMPFPFFMGNCNPTNNWVKEKFYDPFIAGTLNKKFYFQVAKIEDNAKHLSKQYLESLELLDEVIKNRFVKGMWDSVDEIDQLVSWKDIFKCAAYIDSSDRTKYLGVDVGHRGADPTVFYMITGDNISLIESYKKTSTVQVRDKIIKLILMHDLDQDKVCVDAVGIGAGVLDELEERGYNRIIAMRGGEVKAVKDKYVGNFRFAHLKAWSYWIAGKAIKDGAIGNLTNQILKSEAGSIKYVIKKDKVIYTETKAELRKRIGRSCDHWDAFVYAIWAKMQNYMFNPLAQLVTSNMLDKEEEKKKPDNNRSGGNVETEPDNRVSQLVTSTT